MTEGNAQTYSKLAGGRPSASQYRLAAKSVLDFPNRFVGPERCGECHAIQYQKWKRSRHAQTLRFPGEHPEVNNDLKKKLYGSQASILPDGIMPDDIYVTVGTPRTKYGFIDKWLVRGSYHVRDGLLSDLSGTIVAGGNQFSRGWAQWLTPEKAKEIQKVIPDFPTELSKFGPSASHQWGMTSYGSTYEQTLLFQSATSYCEVCHSFKFDFKSKDEFFKALGNAKELQKHTISRGITCEECHGAGGHLVGAESNGFQTNCERCHQRSNFVESDYKLPSAQGKLEKGFNITADKKPIGYVLSIEGADSFITVNHVERAYAYGLRAVGPAHYGPGRYANGTDSTGHLNAMGKELLRTMDRLDMILDVTHLCDEAFWDALDLYKGPIWASHNNCRAFVDHNRQFSDEMIKALIERGAVIGIALDAWMMVPNWVRGESTPRGMNCGMEIMANNIDHVCQLAGNANHVAIGSDLDGAFGTEQCPYDLVTIADLQKIFPILQYRGFTDDAINRIASGNWIEFLRKHLPE